MFVFANHSLTVFSPEFMLIRNGEGGWDYGARPQSGTRHGVVNHNVRIQVLPHMLGGNSIARLFDSTLLVSTVTGQTTGRQLTSCQLLSS